MLGGERLERRGTELSLRASLPGVRGGLVEGCAQSRAHRFGGRPLSAAMNLYAAPQDVVVTLSPRVAAEGHPRAFGAPSYAGSWIRTSENSMLPGNSVNTGRKRKLSRPPG